MGNNKKTKKLTATRARTKKTKKATKKDAKKRNFVEGVKDVLDRTNTLLEEAQQQAREELRKVLSKREMKIAELYSKTMQTFMGERLKANGGDFERTLQDSHLLGEYSATLFLNLKDSGLIK